MKWYFAINESGLSAYEHMIKAAVISAKKYTNLQPHCIYSGKPNAFTSWLNTQGVIITSCESTLTEEITSTPNTGKWNRETATGAYLRLDIPLIEHQDEFVFYTDCDVVFTAKFTTPECRPTYFAAAPENDPNDWSYANTGAMIINVKSLRSALPAIKEKIKGKLNSLVEKGHGTYDQAVLNYVFNGLWDRLPVEYNWKPYWGVNEAAKLIHFHGPKPSFIAELISPRSRTPIPAEYQQLYKKQPIGMAYYLGLFDSFGFENECIQRGHIDTVARSAEGNILVEGWYSENGRPALDNLRFFVDDIEISPHTKMAVTREDVANFLSSTEKSLGFIAELDLSHLNQGEKLKVSDRNLRYELVLPNGIREILDQIFERKE